MSSTQQPTDSTDNNQPTPTAQKSGMTRRDLLRRSAVGGATLAGVSTGAVRLDHGPVQESEAIAPAVAAAGATLTGAGGISAGWLLRSTDPFSQDLSEVQGEFVENSALDTVRARQSYNQSTFVDNTNIVDNAEHVAYSDGKIAAIDELNEERTKEEVNAAAKEAVEAYYTTLLKNLLKSWNEAVNELYTLVEMLNDSSEADATSFFDMDSEDQSSEGIDYFRDMDTVSYDLPNGEEFEINRVVLRMNWQDDNMGNAETTRLSPISISASSDNWSISSLGVDANGEISYLWYGDWNPLISEIEDQYPDVIEGIEKYVDGVYGDLQSGELDTAELLTPREQAELTSDDEDFPQAIADLQALNVGVDLEREAEIYLPEIEATLWGQISYSGDASLETGEIDPDDKGGSIYLTYDVSQGQGEWSAYDEGIDGGNLTFTAEPFADTTYYVDTVAGETVELTADDFEEEDEWVVDLSDELETAITEVAQVEYYAKSEETQYETILLQDPFEIVRYTDSDGNEYDETSFERSEPHSDENYITEEEWKEQQERNEELNQKFEDAQGGGISIPGVDDVLDGEANGLIGITVVGLVFVFGILSALNPLS